jgi:hypothetical protein
MWKERSKKLTIEQILKIPQEEWGGLSELLKEGPDGFQRAYSSLENTKKYIGIAKMLFLPGFAAEFRKLRDRDDTEPVFFISMWLLSVFVNYSLLSPGKMGERALKKCLLLSHNAQCIYREFWEFAAAYSATLPNFKHTEKVNIDKRRKHEELKKQVMEIDDSKAASSPMFTNLSKSGRARIIRSALKNLGINTSGKTIIRLLDTRTSV